MTGTRLRTNGGAGGTSGDALRRRQMLWLAAGMLLFTAVQSVAIVESKLTDLAKDGAVETRAHVWIWQLTSVGVWIALTPLIWWLVARLRPPRFAWPIAVLLHAVATVPVSVVHVVAMVALRNLIYAAGGEHYSFEWPMALIYEYRKDVASYLMFAAFLAFSQWLLARAASPAEQGPRILQVSDGGVTHRVPFGEIVSAVAAGNYVEVDWAGRTLLHRSTLAALAETLGPDFAQIHRGKLVRRDAVRSVETERSGDFTVTLAGGETLRGSRRFRSGL